MTAAAERVPVVDYRRQLGRIRSAKLAKDDHGCISLTLQFEFGGSSQAFAPVLYSPIWPSRSGEDGNHLAQARIVGAAAAWDLLYSILELFEVESVEELNGQVAYALRDEDGFSEYIRGIERIEADGGAKFHLGDWRKKWGLD